MMFKFQNYHCPLCDLDQDTNTWILKVDLDMVKMCQHTKNEVVKIDRQTTHTRKFLL